MNIRKFLGAAALLIALAVAAAPAHAFIETLERDGSPLQIPLPGKGYIRLSEATSTAGSTNAADPRLRETISAIYARVEGGRLHSLFYVRYNKQFGPGGGWVNAGGQPGFPECDADKKHYFTKIDHFVSIDVECLTVWHVPTATQRPGITKNAYDDLIRKNVKVPNYLVGANFVRADRSFYVVFEMFFNPEFVGVEAGQIPAGARAWSKGTVETDPARHAFIEDVRSFALSWAPLVARGLRGNLRQEQIEPVAAKSALVARFEEASRQPPPPPQTQIPTPRPSPAQPQSLSDKRSSGERLRELQSLFDQKLITPAEYADKRKSILDGL